MLLVLVEQSNVPILNVPSPSVPDNVVALSITAVS